jgi:molybdopterin-guanine dinucleotide biosynthesis protein A
MGRDKALLVWNDSTLLEKACAVVGKAAGSVTIVGDSARYSGFGYPVIGDIISGCGPLGGIHAALAFSKADWNLVVACDMPGLNAESLAALIAQVERFPAADALVPEVDGQAQPLCAVYHRRALPVIERALRVGRWKIMQAIEPLAVVRLQSGDEGLFRNVNTPEEWAAASAGF